MSLSDCAPQFPSALLVLAAVGAASAAGAQSSEEGLRADLEILARRTVFFGHQSVGGNILEGVRALAAREGVDLRIVEAPGPVAARGTWAHRLIGENERPLLKVEDFERALGSGSPPEVDLALMKFCYADFQAGTDPSALFQSYREAIGRLKARFPHTTFVHVTSPLTAVQAGWKAKIKRWLGRAGAEALNERREDYNARLREAYLGKEPLFDLARVEATRPDGGEETATVDGRAVRALVRRYSDDGSHLNAEGARRAARALIAVLAAVPEGPGAESAGRR